MSPGDGNSSLGDSPARRIPRRETAKNSHRDFPLQKRFPSQKRPLITIFWGQNRYFQQLLGAALSYNRRQRFRSCSRPPGQRLSSVKNGFKYTLEQRRLRPFPEIKRGSGIFQVLPPPDTTRAPSGVGDTEESHGRSLGCVWFG